MASIVSQVLIGRSEVRNRLQVIDAAPIEESGEVGGSLRGVHCEFGHTLRDDRNHIVRVAAGTPKRSPD